MMRKKTCKKTHKQPRQSATCNVTICATRHTTLHNPAQILPSQTMAENGSKHNIYIHWLRDAVIYRPADHIMRLICKMNVNENDFMNFAATLLLNYCTDTPYTPMISYLSCYIMFV